MKTKLLLTVLLSFCLVPLASAQIPQTMSYQGVLTDAAGNPVADGLVSLTFKLYDVAENGEALWEETQDVKVTDGIFNVILGSQTPLTLPFDTPYWLGITVGEENELTPRTALTAAPYSLNAASTLVEPEPGQGLVIRDESGEATHQFSPEGDVTHTGTGTFLTGIVIGDTVVVPVDTSGAVVNEQPTPVKRGQLSISANTEEIGLRSKGTEVGVLGDSPGGTGVQGQSRNGIGVSGHSESADHAAVYGKNRSDGPGVEGASDFGPGVEAHGDPAGLFVAELPPAGPPGELLAGDFRGQVRITVVPTAPDPDWVLVWDADRIVKAIPREDIGGGEFDGTLVGNPFHLINANGDTVFSVATDGTSLHTGEEVFEDGIRVDGVLNAETLFVNKSQGTQSPFTITLGDTDRALAVSQEGTVDGFVFDINNESTGGGLQVNNLNPVATNSAFSIQNLSTNNPAVTVQHSGAGSAMTLDILNEDFDAEGLFLGVPSGSENFNSEGFGMNIDVGGTSMIGVQSVASGNAGAFINNSPDLATMFAFNFDTTGLGFSTNANMQVDGDLEVGGDVMKGGGGFKIDHPLDPANKYLNHSFVESPQRMNVYNGNIVLDGNGEAVVELPDWFEALNTDFRYQLTCIGGFAQVYIADEIQGNRFKIAGGTAGLKVSWQVTGVRKDAYAQANPLPVEEQKDPGDIGRYRHPEAFGQPREAGTYYARPEVRKMMAEKQNSIPAMK